MISRIVTGFLILLLASCGVSGSPHMQILRKGNSGQTFLFEIDPDGPTEWQKGAISFELHPEEKDPEVLLKGYGGFWSIEIYCLKTVELEYGAQVILCDGKRIPAVSAGKYEQPRAPLEKGRKYIIRWYGSTAHAVADYTFTAE
jgi:hypothetical protein